MGRTVRYLILGALRLCDDSGVARPVVTPRERTVLALLLLHPNRVVRTTELIEALWGTWSPATAAGQVAAAVTHLRRLLRDVGLGGSVLYTEAMGYRLRVETGELDAARFAVLADSGHAAAERGDLRVARRDMRAALELWRGPVLADAASRRVADEAAVLTEQRWALTEDRMEVELRLGRAAAVVDELMELVDRQPLRERLRGQLMTALAELGRTAEATSVFEVGSDLLRREHNAVPAPPLRELHQRLRRGAGWVDTEPPRCLPADIGTFTGRDEVIADLLAAVPADPSESPAVPVVIAIDGMAGVGKTALAVRLGHLVGDRYPDGHLFLNLHGHSERAPLDPAAGLAALLRQLGVPGERIPFEPDQRVALWRTTAARRRLLVIADDAAGVAQVVDLLPGTARALILVTSRRRLADLDGVRHVSLVGLPPRDAADLLANVVGDRARDERAAAAELAALCGNLPLGLRVAAARLTSRPMWTVGDYVTRLKATGSAVAQLGVGGRSVAAAFTLSYRQLAPEAGRVFRRAALHPAGGFDGYAAAVLADLPPAVVTGLLEELVESHLLESPAAGRYQLHQLLREYGSLLVDAEEPAERVPALRRMFDYYVHTTHRATAADELPSMRAKVDLGPPPAATFVVPDQVTGLEWLVAEWSTVVALTELAERLAWHRYVYLLPRLLWSFLFRRAHANEAVDLLSRAVRAADALGEPDLVAAARNYRAAAYMQLSRSDDAIADLSAAAAYWHSVGDPAAENAQVNLAAVYSYTGLLRESLDTIRLAGPDVAARSVTAPAVVTNTLSQLGRYPEALDVARAWLAKVWWPGSGPSGSRAVALGEIGRIHRLLGHHRLAALLLRRALRMKRAGGNRYGEVESISELALAYQGLGRLDEALTLHREAVLAAQGGVTANEMRVRNDYGQTLLAAGAEAAAEAEHRVALALAEQVRVPFEQARAHAGVAAALAGRDPAAAGRHRAAADDLHGWMTVPIAARLGPVQRAVR